MMSNKFFISLMVVALLLLGACSTNPATGQQQFTALMSPAQEKQIGAQQHEEVVKTMGIYDNKAVQDYVSEIGQRLAKNTERKDVKYTFTVVDSPTVNAFALPGGYVYVTRGLMTLANNEAELAGVIGHEIAHVTARHSAERYSQGVLASLGTAALSIALDSPDVSKVAGVGSELYLKSYSRGQESESDDLGIRYLYRAGYDPYAMASFLSSLDQSSKLEGQIEGRNGDGFSYFSTHPRTSSRFAEARAIAANYPPLAQKAPRRSYLGYLDGMIYGDSAAQGFAKGSAFYHPKLGFTFNVPDDFRIYNTPKKIVAQPKSKDGTVIVFDGAARQNGMDARTYLATIWLDSEKTAGGIDSMTVNGMNAATASFDAQVNNKPVTVRVVAVEWSPTAFFRFMVAIPKGSSAGRLEDLKRTTYSLRPMTAQEKQSIKPDHIRIVTAQGGDTAKSLSAGFPFADYHEERFRVLNGMKAGEQVKAGFRYKVISSN